MRSTLEIGQQYSKASLSEIFSDPTLATVREGIYSAKDDNTILLFVDLIKDGKEDRFHFNDFFDGDIFHWDSQTTQHINSPRIQKIVNKEVDVLLFCRLLRKVKGVTQPFIFCGALEYLIHEPNTAYPVHIELLSVDFNENTTDSSLREIYDWKPVNIGRTTSNDDYRGARSKKATGIQKKPNYTERKGLVTSRVGQGYYRQEILRKWDFRCAITGCDIQPILIASHIKRWSECNDDERLDVANGILLSPDIDALFDKHLISFTNDGTILIANSIGEINLSQLAISRSYILNIDEKMLPYLEDHRKEFFSQAGVNTTVI